MQSEISVKAINPKRILLVKAAGIGDLVLAVPAIRALRSRFPQAKIDLLVTPKCSALLKDCPYIDHTYIIRTEGMKNRIRMKDLWDIASTLYQLRKNQYDLLINLYHLFTRQGAFRMRLLCKAIGPDVAMGRNTDGRGGFYDLSIDDSWDKRSFDLVHEAELNLDLVKLLGAEDTGQGLEFWIQGKDRSSMEKILKQETLLEKRGPRIVLNVGGDALYKRWPDEYCSQLGDLLAKRLSAQVIVVGGEKERPVAHRVVEMMEKRPIDLAGKLSISELAALLESSDLMVTNDTGPMHLAAAVGTPVIALFGPGKPNRYAPYGPTGCHIVIHHPIDCSPCTDFHCAHRRCMKAIHPEEVLSAVEQRLSVKQEICS